LIGTGVVLASYHLVRLFLTRKPATGREKRLAYQGARLKLSRFLAMALEFQLAADLLGTTVAPSWDQLGPSRRHCGNTNVFEFLALEIGEEEKAEREAKEAAAAGG
jgi:uncharacterized membrane protein